MSFISCCTAIFLTLYSLLNWLHDEVTDGLLDPHSYYVILRKDRKLYRGEGVCIFIKKCFSPIPVIFDSKYDDLEIIGFD